VASEKDGQAKRIRRMAVLEVIPVAMLRRPDVYPGVPLFG
jgi:hypothetical protein